MKKLQAFLFTVGMGLTNLVAAQQCDGTDCGLPGGDTPVVSVPEPAFYLLIASGLVGLGVARFLKNKK